MSLEVLARAITDSQKDAEHGKQREELRMKKPPFKTIMEPSHEEVVDQLRGWTPPQHAFILYEKKFREHGLNMDGKVRYTLHTQPIGARPDQGDRVRFNVKSKGMRILHWGNFPAANDLNPRIQQLAKMQSDPNTGYSAYAGLEAVIKSYLDLPDKKDEIIEQKDIQIDDLNAKYLAEKKRADELEKLAKKDSKNNPPAGGQQ